MTLTGRLPAERHESILAKLRRRFAALELSELAVDSIAVFRQQDANSQFRVVQRYALTAEISEDWIASSRSLSSGPHSRDPLAPRNTGRPYPVGPCTAINRSDRPACHHRTPRSPAGRCASRGCRGWCVPRTALDRRRWNRGRERRDGHQSQRRRPGNSASKARSFRSAGRAENPDRARHAHKSDGGRHASKRQSVEPFDIIRGHLRRIAAIGCDRGVAAAIEPPLHFRTGRAMPRPSSHRGCPSAE